MTLSSGRADRRRRILNDGRLTGEATSDTRPGAENPPPGGAPRYAPGEASVSFGLASRVLPTGAGALTGVLFAGLLLTAGLVAGDVYRAEIAALAGEPVAGLLDIASPASLATALNHTLALTVVGLTGVVYGLRRHRSDDLRGTYRWWIVATLAAATVCLCQMTNLHQVAAGALATRVGWSPLPSDAFWWLAPGGVLLGGLAVRLFFDLKESRLAATGAVLAGASACVAVAATQGWAPVAYAEFLPIVGVAATHTMLITSALALLAFSRRIVREANGRAAAPVKRKKPTAKTSQQPAAAKPADKSKPASKNAAAKRVTKAASTPAPVSEIAQTPPTAAEATQWVDGTQGGDDDYGDDAPRRKLSKAERKRLRRQKARQGRAA